MSVGSLLGGGQMGEKGGSPAGIDRALELLYESVLVPESLAMALAELTRLIDGDTCHLVAWERCSGLPTLSLSHALPVEVGPDYAAHYAAIDPRRRLAIEKPPGFVLNCHKYFDPRFVQNNEFYQDYLIPDVGVQYLLGAGDLLPEDDQLVMIGFQRYVGHAAFSDEEAALLECVLPHLRRTLRLRRQVQVLADLHACTDSFWEQSNLATMAISATGKLLWCNRQGRALLQASKGLYERHGCLHAQNPERDPILQQALRSAIATGRPANINLGMPDAGAHCCLTLMRLAHGVPDAIFPEPRAALLVVVSTNDWRRLASVRQLIQLLGLTPAEARLARALAGGESLDSHAEAEGVKKTTVRTQLRCAFAKTATTNQKDLVRLVLGIHPVRE